MIANRYRYEATNAKGKRQAGTVDAQSEKDAAQQIRALGLFPTFILPLDRNGVKPKRMGRGYRLRRFGRPQEDGWRLEYRTSWLRWLGILPPLVCWGLVVPVWRASYCMSIPFGLIALAASFFGLLFLLQEEKIVVDRRTRTITRSHRIVPFRSKNITINAQELVGIVLRSRIEYGPGEEGSAGTRASIWSVNLKKKDGTLEEMDTSSAEAFEKDMAQKLAQYLGLPQPTEEHKT